MGTLNKRHCLLLRSFKLDEFILLDACQKVSMGIQVSDSCKDQFDDEFGGVMEFEAATVLKSGLNVSDHCFSQFFLLGGFLPNQRLA